MQKLPAFVAIVLIFVAGCKNNSSSDAAEASEIKASGVPAINYTVVGYSPHDTILFTEGFVYHDGKLFEASGNPEEYPYTRSQAGFYDAQSQKFISKTLLGKEYFGEGITFLGNKFYELTWKGHTGFIFDAKTFKQIGTFNYQTEGWALTTDGKYLIMDDGTDKIYYLDPVKFTPVKVLSVTRNGAPQDTLNELEFIKGNIYANIWHSNEIIRIDTATGKITGSLNLASVVSEAQMRHPEPGENVLNGIAYDSVHDKIYITGKLWQNIYQINFPH